MSQGGMALGSAFWGLVAERVSLSTTLLLAAATLAVGVTAMLRYRLRLDEEIDLTPSQHWPEPILSMHPEPDAGPVLVTVEYEIDAARAQDFVTAMQSVRIQRLRDGAYR